MKKIMFNDRYGLTHAVLSGQKTQTRRTTRLYKVGEVVAIAQCYESIYNKIGLEHLYESFICTAGWNNKMFVKAELMPHHIRITKMRVERLQNISDEDCLKDGIRKAKNCGKVVYGYNTIIDGTSYTCLHYTPREAFASLIDKVSGKGTWETNKKVYVYEFELVN